jgi:hypothetical protein
MEKSSLTPDQQQWLANNFPRVFEASPDFFFEKILGVRPWDKQLEIALAVRDYRETAVFSCHAAGKTWVASKIALWFMFSYPGSIVITTAPTYRQVKDLLWREIRTSFDRAIFKPVKKANTTNLNFATDWYSIGLSTNDPDKFQGYHATSGHLLVIADESAGIEELIFEAVDAVLTTPDTRLLMIGNPTSSSGRFYKAFRQPGVKKIQIKAWDTPNFVHNNIKSPEDLCAIYDPPADMSEEDLQKWQEPQLPHPNPRLLSPVAAHQMIHKFGIESPWFQSRVEAIFPDQGEDTLIPLSWIERAMTKKRREGDWELVGPPTESEPAGEKKWIEGITRGDPRIGVDPARFGDDRTVILYREGHNVRDVRAYRKENTIQTADRVKYNLRQHNIRSNGRVAVDGGGGYGGGVVDNLVAWLDDPEQINEGYRVPVSEVMVAKPPTHDPYGRFYNLRAQLYWELRTLFEENKIAIPDTALGEELANELSQIKFVVMPGGKIKIEEKAEMKKRLLRSPDLADALMISYATPTLSEFVDEEKKVKFAPYVPPEEREHEFILQRERALDRSNSAPTTAGMIDEQF